MKLKYFIISLIVSSNFTTFPQAFGDNQEINITVDLTARMVPQGRDTLPRHQYFATNASDLSLPIADALKAKSFWPGRVPYDVSANKLPEDPDNPGTVSPSYFDEPLKISDTMLSLGEGMPNYFSCVLPIYSCPSFMQGTNMPNTPADFDDYGNVVVDLLLNLEKFSIIPDYYELWNEPSNPHAWGWMVKSTSSGWSKFVDYSRTLIPKLKRATRSIKIAGPADGGVSEWPLNGFKKWSEKKGFIDKVGENLDLLSFHFTQMNPSQFNASLDLIANYTKYTLKTTKPILISEFSGDLGDNTPTPANYWSALHSAFEETIVCINHPIVEKAVSSFIPVARPHTPHTPQELFDSNGPTPLYHFVEIWEPVTGYYLYSSSNDNGILSTAFLNDMDLQTVYLAVVNTTDQNQVAEVNFKGNGTVTQTKESRLYWDGTEPVYTSASADINDPLQFTPNECKVLTLSLDKPLENLPEVTEEIFYSGIYLAPILSHITTLIELPPNTTNAVLRYSTQRPDNSDLAPAISVNGHLLPSTAAPVGGKENFGSAQVEIPAEFLDKKNSVTLTYKKSGGYVVSIAILATFAPQEK